MRAVAGLPRGWSVGPRTLEGPGCESGQGHEPQLRLDPWPCSGLAREATGGCVSSMALPPLHSEKRWKKYPQVKVKEERKLHGGDSPPDTNTGHEATARGSARFCRRGAGDPPTIREAPPMCAGSGLPVKTALSLSGRGLGWLSGWKKVILKLYVKNKFLTSPIGRELSRAPGGPGSPFKAGEPQAETESRVPGGRGAQLRTPR